ncbi:hypothetical protein ACFIJ5_17765 [Haloimpatiens sp. FM7330]|uniref:hypothetical protein n=1 Tax=Haloimpatiens sp. FM7330 TaxID=3298610 RepID=UPI003641FF34
MAVIVRHNETKERFVLLGTGYAAYKDSSPSPIFGNFVRDNEEGQKSMIAVCDKKGKVKWLRSDKVVIEKVDGEKLEKLL